MENQRGVNELAEALRRFNRKERNLLIRDALGDQENRLQLSKKFREKLQLALSISVREDAWWATDYHLNWLAGALNLYANGEETIGAPYQNPLLRDERRLVEPNQEDLDMVVVSDCNLILIEAKAFGAWGNRQMASKVQRLTFLQSFYGSVAGAASRPVQFHFVLASPRPSKRLKFAGWPSWMLSANAPRRVELVVPTSPLAIARCDDNGHPSESGDHWKIVQVRLVAGAPETR